MGLFRVSVSSKSRDQRMLPYTLEPYTLTPKP